MPNCIVEGGNAAWINAKSSLGRRTITATCTDEMSGCATAQFSHTYSTNINTTTAGAAGNRKGGTVYDKAGNSRDCEANQTVKIDKNAPKLSSITNSSDNEWTNGSVIIRATASDTGGSGIAHTKYYYEAAGTRYNEWDSDSTSTSVKRTWSAHINQNVYIRVCDKVGYCSDPKTSWIHIVDACDSGYTTIGSYGDWESCSAACGPGTQYRDVYLVSSFNSSISCGPRSTQDSQSCNVAPCECSHEYGTYGSAPGNYPNYYEIKAERKIEYSDCAHSKDANGPNGTHKISKGQVIKKVQCVKCKHQPGWFWCPNNY